MSFFGLTPDLWLRQIGMKSDAFTRGSVEGSTIIADAMREAASFITSQLPRRLERMLRIVENEWICKRAYGGQTAVMLGAPCNPNTLIVWLIPVGYSLTSAPQIGDSTQLVAGTDYTIAQNNQSLTLTNPLSAGDRVMASYDSTLSDNCPTLRYHLIAVMNYRLATEACPESSDRYAEQYERTMDYFEKLSTGRATLAEVSRIETLQDGDLTSIGVKAAMKSEPA